MAQVNTYQRAPLAGDEAQYHNFINGVVQAVITNSAGPVAPTETYPYMNWLDTSVTPPRLMRRDATNGLWKVAQQPATQAEAEGAVDDTKFMTPLRTAQAIAALVPESGLVKIADYDLVGKSELAITDFDPAKYNGYILKWRGVLPDVDNARMQMQFSDNGGSSYFGSSNSYRSTYRTAATYSTNLGAYGILATGVGANATEIGLNGEVCIDGLDIAGWPSISFRSHFESAAGSFGATIGDLSHNSNAVMNGVRFYWLSGGFATGEASLYGYAR